MNCFTPSPCLRGEGWGQGQVRGTRDPGALPSLRTSGVGCAMRTGSTNGAHGAPYRDGKVEVG